jgi:hypothetical protein
VRCTKWFRHYFAKGSDSNFMIVNRTRLKSFNKTSAFSNERQPTGYITKKMLMVVHFDLPSSLKSMHSRLQH